MGLGFPECLRCWKSPKLE